ncbi:hypothetical protein F4810DRAFT_325326 [Camillea tinctor]|nr:hypothetical protein F4810DRAFT_325326 [Camillea tinctor]
MASALVPPGVDPCTVPSGMPPPGQTWNFDNPVSVASITIAICTIMTACALVFVTARIYVNKRALNLSDYFMIVATVLDLAFAGVIISMIKYNRHQWDIPLCWINGQYMKFLFVNTILVGPALYFSKSSIFLMYRQFFSVKREMRIAIIIGLIATFLIYIPSIPLAAIFSAPRVGHSWEELIITRSIELLIPWGIVQGTVSLALDIYIFILPIPILSKLNITFSKRLQLLAVFATALMGVTASVIALAYRIKLVMSADSTWQQAALWMAIVVENNVAIIVGSMPAFANFIRIYVSETKAFKSLQSMLRGSRNDSSKDIQKAPQGPELATFGSPRPRGPSYYELTDSAIMRTQLTTNDSGVSLNPENGGK